MRQSVARNPHKSSSCQHGGETESAGRFWNPIMALPRDPSQPLREKQEAFAFARACGYPINEACRIAGGNPDTGIGSKWDAQPKVKRRIAYIRALGNTDEILAAKRRRVEERLEHAAYGNIFDFSTINKRGDPEIDWPAVKASPFSVAIAEFVFDKDTGRLTRFKRDDALNAVAQLRDMHGFKAPARTELTAKDGAPLLPDIPDEVRVRALQALLAKTAVKENAA